jgi:hypothetical protein
MKKAIAAVTAAAAAVATLSLAPTASADPKEDATFLSDLRGIWNFSFDAGSAVREAHAMCGMPKGQTASALPDIIRLIDPSFTGGDEQVTVVMDATKFMKVAAEHFCPST